MLKATDFQVEKVVTGFLNEPIDIVTTGRHTNFGNVTGLYHSYILNRNGTVAVYESGPDGVNGIGFKDIIGTIPNAAFRNPRGMSIDLSSLMGGVYISHSDELGNGQVSRLEMFSSPPGPMPIQQNNGGFLLPPTFRQKEWAVTSSFGGFSPTNPNRDLLSGRAPGDIAVDEMFNYSTLPGQVTTKNASIQLSPFGHSEKDAIKIVGNSVLLPYLPKFIFIAITDRGVVDVFNIGSGEKVTSIDVGGTPSVLSQYWRQ